MEQYYCIHFPLTYGFAFLLYYAVVTCPVLVSPPNADVQHPQGVEYQSTATYTCDSGYERSSGDLQRDCSADGTWTGNEPVCVGEYIFSL